MSFFFSFSGDRGKATLNKNQLYAFHMQPKILYIYIYKEGERKIIRYTRKTTSLMSNNPSNQ